MTTRSAEQSPFRAGQLERRSPSRGVHRFSAPTSAAAGHWQRASLQNAPAGRAPPCRCWRCKPPLPAETHPHIRVSLSRIEVSSEWVPKNVTLIRECDHVHLSFPHREEGVAHPCGRRERQCTRACWCSAHKASHIRAGLHAQRAARVHSLGMVTIMMPHAWVEPCLALSQ